MVYNINHYILNISAYYLDQLKCSNLLHFYGAAWNADAV